MGIDRPDEDTAPDVRPDSPTAGHDARLVEHDSPPDGQYDIGDSDADRVAYCLKYRDTVETEYRAAWAEAVPAFQSTWKEHQERYTHPERSRPTVGDDGSWRGDGGRLELSSPQNAEVGWGHNRIREIGKGDVLPTMQALEAEDQERRLAGLKNYLKEPDRLKEKVAADIRFKGYTVEQSLTNVKDAVRFTFVYTEERYTEGVHADCTRLEARGFERYDRQNSWRQDQYKGINSRWREPKSGLLFEVQFHTQASFDAKELTHGAYERLRGSVAEDAEREELEAFQSMVCAKIPIPPGATEIEDYSPERRDG